MASQKENPWSRCRVRARSNTAGDGTTNRNTPMNSCSRAQACSGVKPCEDSFREAATNSTATCQSRTPSDAPARRSNARSCLWASRRSQLYQDVGIKCDHGALHGQVRVRQERNAFLRYRRAACSRQVDGLLGKGRDAQLVSLTRSSCSRATSPSGFNTPSR